MRLVVDGNINADTCNAFGIYILEKNLPEEYRQRLYNKLFALCEKEAKLVYKRMKIDIWSEHFAHEVAEKKAKMLFFNSTLANIIYDTIKLRKRVREMESEYI
jgi:hypothetical protein|nr:MAG TPA: hypothetical protein [Caudoviricetes sp.]